MYTDCFNVLTFMDEFVPICDAVGAQAFINSRECSQSTNALFVAQKAEFLKWIEMQMTTVHLRHEMALGRISLSAAGSEPPVVVKGIQDWLDKLSVLRDPSQNLKNALHAGRWIVKVNYLYCIVLYCCFTFLFFVFCCRLFRMI
jgi:hypothetical protein